MESNKDVQLVTLSALQHYAFCPRQCALIHIEQVWADNYLTATGHVLHKRVDEGLPETRMGVRFERAIAVKSNSLGLVGKLDLVELAITTGQLTPVEYKKGTHKEEDEIQLCAQALCLEEMRNQHITRGYIWYWKTRRRVEIDFDEVLRVKTKGVIEQVRSMLTSKKLPRARYQQKCEACSLIDLCQPKLLCNDRSASYVEQLFKE